MSLKGFFKTEVVTCSPNQSITEAASLMRDHGVGDVIVVRKDGRKQIPVGVLTDRDIAIGCVASGPSRLEDVSVEDIMTPKPVCATENSGIYETVQKMRKEGVARMPVTKADGSLCGVVTASNLLSLFSQEINEIVGINGHHRTTGNTGSPRNAKAAKRRSSQDARQQLQ